MDLRPSVRPPERPSFLDLPESTHFSRENDDVFLTESPVDDSGPYEECSSSDRPRRLSSSRSLPCVQERSHDKGDRSDSAPSPMQLTGSSCDTPMTDSFPASTPSREDDDTQSRSAYEGILQCERDFFDFVMTLPSEPKPNKPSPAKSRRESKGEPKPKVGLDHLDNLCKLMEQLGDLKEQNSKLHRRVQYLEDVKNLHEMHKDILSRRPASMSSRQSAAYDGSVYQERYQAQLEDRAFENPLQKSKTQICMGSLQRKTRERSRSVGNQEEFNDPKGSLKAKKFPNWSKVKEALGFEQRQSDYNVDGNSFREGNRILGPDVVHNISIPVYSDDYDRNFDGKAMAVGERCRQKEPWTDWSRDRRLQSKHYPDERPCDATCERKNHLRPQQPVRRRSSPTSPTADKDRFSDHSKKEQYSLTLGPNAYQTYARTDLKDDLKKAPKTPWGRVKTLIQTKRGSVKKRQSTKCEGKEFRMDFDPSSNAAFSDYEEGVSRRTRDARHRRRKVSDQYADGGSNRHSGLSDDFCGFPKERSKSQTHIECDYYRDFESSEDSRPRKQKPAPLALSPVEHASSSAGHSRTSSGVTSETYQRLSPRSSPQFQRKSRWNKVKKVFTAKAKDGDTSTPPTAQYPFSKSVPASPLSLMGTVFNYEDLGPYEDEDMTKTREESVDRQRVDSLPLSLCPSSDGELSLFPLSQSASTPMSSLVLQLQRNLSDDFSQKMLEWERIKASGVAPTATTKDRAKSKSEKLKGERQPKPVKPKIKDLTWLNKELHKIEREKERLAKEKRKYDERSSRLQRLKHTLLSSGENRNEILVRTSAGEFRFEGISDAFTKKLYEWETKKGVVPELSTIALLDASLSGEKGLPRGLSRSDSSIADQVSTHHQASHGSTSSLPSMKPDSGFSQEENVQQSRANSEPDLSTPHGQARRDSCASRRRHSQDQKWPAGDYGAYVNPEVTWLIDSGSGELALEEEERRLTKSPENQDYDEGDAKATEDGYYALLEENMLLLEQLKAKEDVCRQMERELQLLDARLDDVSNRHRKEIDRYRERLWEAHRPALLQSGFRESQASLKVLTDLKSRVDDLERFGRRFYEERRTLQDHMRYHSEDQLRLSRDLVANLRDVHYAGAPDALRGPEGPERRSSSASSWCWQRFAHVEKLAEVQELLAKLLGLAHEVELCAAERAHQLWILRGEILQRDLVSAQTLHSDLNPLQRGASKRVPWKRCPPMPKRSLSDGIIQHLRNSKEDIDNPLSSKGNLDRKSRTESSEWQLNTTAAQLLETVQQLKTELLGLLCDVMNTESEEGQECVDGQEQPSLESGDIFSETRAEDGSGGEARLSLASSDSPIRPSEMVPGNATVRHNSADNVSSVSGHDGSESSSLNDSERVSFVLRLPLKSWTRTRETVSSSSDSSYLEDDTFTRAAWSSAMGKNRLEASERKKDATEAFNSSFRLRDEVFEEPSSASSVEAIFSLPYPCHVYSGTGKFNAAVAEETADMLRDAEGTSHFGCNETAEATVTLCQPGATEVLEALAEGTASYANDGASSNSEELPEVSEIGKMAARGESPVLRSKSTRKLKKAKEVIEVPRTEKQPQSFPSVSSTASSPPLSPAKIISDEELITPKQESANHDTYHSVLKRDPSTGYVPSPVHSTSSASSASPLSPASPPSPVPSYSHIPYQGALLRFEALHRAKTEFFAKEGPVIISADVLTPRVLQVSTTFPQKDFNVETISEVAEPSDPGHGSLPQCGASVPRVSKEAVVPSPAEKTTAEEATRKKSRQESGQADKASFLSLKLKKSKKKDYSTVEELCRQTLTVTVAEKEVVVSGSGPVSPVSPISPPSPSEPRTKGINKWLPIFSTKP